MVFYLTLAYVAVALLSPAVFPDWLMNLHVPLVLGILLILASIPKLSDSKLSSTPETYLVLALLFSTILSTSMTLGFSTAPQTFTELIPVLFSFFFVVIGCNTLARIRWLCRVMIGVGLFVLYFGMLAVRHSDASSPYVLIEGVSGSSLYRICGLGFISDPNDLAQMFAACIPLLWIGWKKGAFLRNLAFTIVPTCLFLNGIYLTHSRGGTVALIAVLLFAFKDKLGLVKSLIVTAVMAVGVMSVDVGGGRGMNDDDGDRVGLWSSGLTVFKTHPFFGVGAGNFSDYTDSHKTAHNSYVLGMAELGSVGYYFWSALIVFGWSGLSMMTSAYAKRKKQAANRDQDLPEFLQIRAPQEAAKEETAGPPALTHFAMATAGGYTEPARSSFMGAGFPNLDTPRRAIPDEQQFASAANMIRVSLVGMLTAGFFLSRTYIMTLYIILGMACALRTIYLEQHPEAVFDTKLLLKRSGYFLIGSITALYLFIRIRGLH